MVVTEDSWSLRQVFPFRIKIVTPIKSANLSLSPLLQGYQMLKNGKLYGSIIPPDVNSLRIRDVSLGEKLTLQLIALTEHPVGKTEMRGGSVVGDKDSGISGSTLAQNEDRSAGMLMFLIGCLRHVGVVLFVVVVVNLFLFFFFCFSFIFVIISFFFFINITLIIFGEGFIERFNLVQFGY
jgi:hypothetical protein